MFSKFFIERPVLANVIAFLTVLLGGVAVLQLPISQYPPITPPTVQVTTNYPGASARTMVETVALPIEQQVNGVEGMLYMQSTCTNAGNYSLIVTFKIGTDPDFAQVLVQNRVAAALAQLPRSVQSQGVVTNKKSTAILQIITLTSPHGKYDSLFLSNYATLRLQNELARLPGVGGVTVFGIGQYSMRVWLDPNKMQARSLVPSDVIQALQRQNSEVTAGQIGMPPTPSTQDFQFTLNVHGALDKAADFEQIIVKTDNNGQITRLGDVGRVELGAQTYSQFFDYDGKPSGGTAIFLLPGANALDTAAAVNTTMKRLAKDFPEDLTYAIPFDTTIFVRDSVNEVYKTLGQAGLLVLLVIMIFLQNWRATLVPATTVPVTIIGAFAAMAVMGFSINLLTLFAVVLAIGIVVDDAIVVVEGVTQYIERGQPPKEAAINAMGGLFGPIIGITLVLMSVFLPSAFMPGITGQMYRQFALVIASTALISAANAVTLKPTQCATWLRRPEPNAKKNFFVRGFNAVYGRVEAWYLGIIRHMVRLSGLMVAMALVLIIVAVWGFSRVPTGFLPTEDQGYVLVAVQLPSASSLTRTQRAMAKLRDMILQTSGVAHTISIGGVSPLDNNASLANGGVIYVMFKDWSQRGKGEGLLDIYNSLSRKFSNFQDASCRVIVPPAIQGLGLSGGFQAEVELTDGSFDYQRLQKVTEHLATQSVSSPVIDSAITTFRADVPQLNLDVDRTEAATFNVAVGDVFDTLQTYLGSSYVNQFTKFGHTFTVFAQADENFRLTPENVLAYYVKSASGDMVPLGSVASVSTAAGPNIISLYNLYPAAAFLGKASEKYSSGQAIETLENLAAGELPSGVGFAWTAMSLQEKIAGSAVYYIFALSLLLVFFMLAGQYESWITPLAVILAVPMALLGTVAALLGLGIPNNMYVQIGLVLLIALSAKNAILVVEMARENRAAGKSIVDSAVEAAGLRFRPIVMTSLTFILGVLPLVLATGAGANSRRCLGITVLTGMIASTCLAVLFVPSLYVVLQNRVERRARRHERHP
jgi:hydrophobic/amphiphilic exporter-1 (mainly G- bacteria), HAE1 family